jgi:hypothetical protein
MAAKMKLGSQKYSTDVMKEDEVLLFVESCIESGSSPNEAIADMRMIDTMLQAERLHKAVGAITRRTRGGNYRRANNRHLLLDAIITGRLNGAF